MKTIKVCILAALAGVVNANAADGGDFMGAEAVVREIQSLTTRPNTPEKNKSGFMQRLADAFFSSAADSINDVTIGIIGGEGMDSAADDEDSADSGVAEGADVLSPEAAAAAWLVRSDEIFKVNSNKKSSFQNYSTSDFEKLIGALPPPAAWSFIREGLEKRQEEKYSRHRALAQILMALLTGDLEAAKDAADKLTRLKPFPKNNYANYAKRDFQNLKSRLDGKEVTDGADMVNEWWNVATNSAYSGWSNDRKIRLYNYDVTELLPQDETERLLREIFARGLDIEFHWYNAAKNKTIGLAQKVALEMRDELKIPYWNLVTGSDEGEELFKVFTGRFTLFDSESSDKLKNACDAISRLIRYMLVNGRTDDAVNLACHIARFVKANPQSKFDGFFGCEYYQEPSVSAEERYGFYVRMIEHAPHLVYSDKDFILAAIACGREDETESAFVKFVGSVDTADPRLISLKRSYAALLLATDRLDECLALHREIIEKIEITSENEYKWFEFIFRSIKLAESAKDTEMLRFFTDKAIMLIYQTDNTYSGYWDKSRLAKIAKVLEMNGRINEVEPLLIKMIVRELNTTVISNRFSSDIEGDNDSSFLKTLLMFYVRQNRMSDALFLLENAPWWGNKRDAVEFLDDDTWYLGETGRGGFNHSLVRMFNETGHKEKAAEFISAIIRDKHSADWMYETLLESTGENLDGFIATMDALHARDAFEERPLIWKAEALRRLKRLDEAEQTARLAIKTDPTDGESPAGERVRSYSVLADILDDKGKTDDAKFFRDVVKAVRIAEEGDTMRELGLFQRSLEKYEEAETLFADAYCVQWRLAERLRERGQHEEARKHYEIAFERMPEQFGQVASLCFGCMGAFDTPDSVSAAEKVLTRLVAEPPVRPAVHYLMGQLRENQNRPDEAADWYSKALESDPDYLDVLIRLYKLRGKTERADTDWKALQNKIIGLDPLGRHYGIDRDDILDWPTFWTIRETALKRLPRTPRTILPLTANTARLDDAMKSDNWSRTSYYSSNTANETPASVLLRTKIVREILSVYPHLTTNEK